MELSEAIEIVVERTGVERYRYLCLEHPNAGVRRDYSNLVLHMAAEPPDRSSGMEVAEWLPMLRKARQCQFRSVGKAGCGCGQCALAQGAEVSIAQCVDCVRRFG